MLNITDWPLPYGVNLVTELSSDNSYALARSQIAVFPFELNLYEALRVDASHSTQFRNQAGTIRAWASNQPNGSSISGQSNQNLARVNLIGEGFSWLLYNIDDNPNQWPKAYITQWIYPKTTYFMCFQNLENKDNSFYVKFTRLPINTAV